MGIRRAALVASAATGVAASITAATQLGLVPLASLAATPRAVDGGRVWLLFTSGVVADNPVVPSLLGFWIVCGAALALCPARVGVRVAVAGHTLSALGAYGVIVLARLADPNALASVVNLPDYGLSAIIAAWIGAIARLLWQRSPSRRGHVLVVLGSLASAGIGLAFLPNVEFLDSEHVLAYAIGFVLVDARFLRAPVRPSRRAVAAAASG
jgi:hypothetical protein